MTLLALACLALGIAIFALEGKGAQTVGPGLTVLLVGAGLFYIYQPFGALPSLPARRLADPSRNGPMEQHRPPVQPGNRD